MTVLTCTREKLVGYLGEFAAREGDYLGLNSTIARVLMGNAADRIAELEAQVARLQRAAGADFGDDVRYLAESQGFVAAVKFVFRRRMIGLKEARDYVREVAPHTERSRPAAPHNQPAHGTP